MLVWAAALAPLGTAAGEREPSRDQRRLSLVSPGGPGTLFLEWLDVGSATSGVDGIARSETRSILKGAGVDVVWRQGNVRDASRPGEIRIILVDRLRVKPTTGAPILGAAPSRLREQPFVWVHVKSVRAALGLGVTGPAQNLPVSSRRDLGVALGRVIAHEVVHALAPDVEHSKELMSESLQPTELTGPRLRVEPEVAVAVQAALGRGVARPGPVVAAGGSAPETVVRAPRTAPRGEEAQDLAR